MAIMIRKYPYKLIIKLILLLIALYIISTYVVGYLINTGFTNSESSVLTLSAEQNYSFPSVNRQIYKYIADNPGDIEEINQIYIYLNGTGRQDMGWFPKNNGGLDFIIAGINKRKIYIDTIKKYSAELGIDSDLVIACVLGEQIRIANKGARGNLKNLILNSTPKLLRSYNISLGIGGIKLTTAFKIRKDAKEYGYGNDLGVVSSSGLADNDMVNATYATYLVKNIITRRQLSGYDISKNPGVVCTLYNFGNGIKKVPHQNPQIGGSVITILGKDYNYGGLSLAVYRYLKIYKDLET